MDALEFADPVYLDDTHRLVRDQLRRFVAEEVLPAGDQWEEAGHVPPEIFRRLGELGMLGLRHPESHGGGGLDATYTVLLAEELGRSGYGGFAASITVHTDMASPHLARFGTAGQKDRYLGKVISGELITAVAITEPGAGSDVAGLRTRARRDGEEYVLDGAKTFITNGVHADLYFVAARTDGEAKGSRGLSMFIVEGGTPGLTVARELKKTGWHSSDTAELVFEDCRVPADALLGAENRGFYQIMENFQTERLSLGASSVGAAERALALTLEWVKQRQAFGEPLWRREAIRQRLAMLAAKTAAARQLTWHAAWLDAMGRDAVREVSMVKAFCGEVLNEVVYDCVQFHGGMGYMRETPVERIARDARVMSIGGGATEVMLEEVAKRM